jgi:hypothetical protein
MGTATPVDPDRTSAHTALYAAAARRAASEAGAALLDLHSLLQREEGWEEGLLADGLHFTPAGQALVGRLLVDLLGTTYPELRWGPDRRPRPGMAGLGRETGAVRPIVGTSRPWPQENTRPPGGLRGPSPRPAGSSPCPITSPGGGRDMHAPPAAAGPAGSGRVCCASCTLRGRALPPPPGPRRGCAGLPWLPGRTPAPAPVRPCASQGQAGGRRPRGPCRCLGGLPRGQRGRRARRVAGRPAVRVFIEGPEAATDR